MTIAPNLQPTSSPAATTAAEPRRHSQVSETAPQRTSSPYVIDAMERGLIDENGLLLSGGRAPISLSTVGSTVNWSTPFIKYLVAHFSKEPFGATINLRRGAFYSLGRPFWEAVLKEKGVNLSLITPEMWSFCTQPPRCFEFWVCLSSAYEGGLDGLQDLVIYFMWLQKTSSPQSLEAAMEDYVSMKKGALSELSSLFYAFKSQSALVTSMAVEMAGTKIIFTQGRAPSESFHLDDIAVELACDSVRVFPSKLRFVWQSLHDCLIGNLQLTAPLNRAQSVICALGNYWARLTTCGPALNGAKLEELLTNALPFPAEPLIASGCEFGLNFIPLTNAALIAYHFNVWHLPATRPDLRGIPAEKPIEKLLISHDYYLVRAVVQVVGVMQQGLPLQEGLRCGQIMGTSHLEMFWGSTIVMPLNFEKALDNLIFCLRADQQATVSCLSDALEIFIPSCAAVTSLDPHKKSDKRLLEIYHALGYDERFFFLMAHDGRISLDEHAVLELPNQVAKAEMLESLRELYRGTRFEHVFNAVEDKVASLECRTPEACRQAAMEALLLCEENQILSLAWAAAPQVEDDFLIKTAQTMPAAALPYAMKHVRESREIALHVTYLERLIRQYPHTLYLTYGPQLVELLEACFQKDPTLRGQLMFYPHVFVTMDPTPLKSLRENLPLVKTDLRVWWSHLLVIEQMAQEKNSFEELDAIFLEAFTSSPLKLKIQPRFNEIHEGVLQRQRRHRVQRLITLTSNPLSDVEEVHALCAQVKPAPHEIPRLLDCFYDYYSDHSDQKMDGIKRCLSYFAAAGDGRFKPKNEKGPNKVRNPAPAQITPAKAAPGPVVAVTPAVTKKAAPPPVDEKTRMREQVVQLVSKRPVSTKNLHEVLSLLEKLPSREWDLWLQLFSCMTAADQKTPSTHPLQELAYLQELSKLHDHSWRVWLKKHPLSDIKTEDGEYWELAVDALFSKMSSATPIFSTFLTTQALRHIDKLEGKACKRMVIVCLELGVISCLKTSHEAAKLKLLTLLGIITSSTVRKKVGCYPVLLMKEEYQNYLHIELAHQPEPALSRPGEEWICSRINEIAVDSESNQNLFKAYCTNSFLPNDPSRQDVIFIWAIKSWEVHKTSIAWSESCLLLRTLSRCSFDELPPPYLSNLRTIWMHMVAGSPLAVSSGVLPMFPPIFEEATQLVMDASMKYAKEPTEKREALDFMYEHFPNQSTCFVRDEARSEFYLNYCAYMFGLMPTSDTDVLRSMQNALIEVQRQGGYLRKGSNPVCQRTIKAFKLAFPEILNAYCLIEDELDVKRTAFTFLRHVFNNFAAKFDSDQIRAQLRLRLCFYIFPLVQERSPAACAAAKIALEDLNMCQRYLTKTNDVYGQKCVAAFIEAIPYLLDQNDTEVTASVQRIIDNLLKIEWAARSTPDKASMIEDCFIRATSSERIILHETVDNQIEFYARWQVAINTFAAQLKIPMHQELVSRLSVVRLELTRLVLSCIHDEQSYIEKHSILLRALDSELESPEAILSALHSLRNNSLFHSMTAATLLRHIKPTLATSLPTIEQFCIDSITSTLMPCPSRQHLTIRAVWIYALSSFMKKLTKRSEVLVELNRRLTTELTQGVLQGIAETQSYQSFSKFLYRALEADDLQVAEAMLAALPSDLSQELIGFKLALELKIASLRAPTESVDSREKILQIKLAYCTHVMPLLVDNVPEATIALTYFRECHSHLITTNNCETQKCVAAFVSALPQLLNHFEPSVLKLVQQSINNCMNIPWVVHADRNAPHSWTQLLFQACRSITTGADERQRPFTLITMQVFLDCFKTSDVRLLKDSSYALGFFFMTLSQINCLTLEEWDLLIGVLPQNTALDLCVKLLQESADNIISNPEHAYQCLLATPRLIRHAKWKGYEILDALQNMCLIVSKDYYEQLEDVRLLNLLLQWIHANSALMQHSFEFKEEFRKKQMELVIKLVRHTLVHIEDQQSCDEHSKMLIDVMGRDKIVALAILNAFSKYGHSYFHHMAALRVAGHLCTDPTLTPEKSGQFCLDMTNTVFTFDPDQNLTIRIQWILLLGKISGNNEITERKKQLTRKLVELVCSRFALSDCPKKLFDAIKTSDPEVAQAMLEVLPKTSEIAAFRGILKRVIEKGKK